MSLSLLSLPPCTSVAARAAPRLSRNCRISDPHFCKQTGAIKLAEHLLGDGDDGRRRRGGVVCMAKKGGKKGGDKKEKKGGSGIPNSAPKEVIPYTQGDVILHSLALIDSYFRATGQPIFSEPVEIMDAPKALFEAPFALLSHGTEEEPILNYGNRAALDLFETGWATLTAMPSSQTAAEGEGEGRAAALKEAEKAPKDLAGIIRVSTKGRSFEVKNGLLWTLTTLDGEAFGQAAIIREWMFLDEEEGTEKPNDEAGPVSELSAGVDADVPGEEKTVVGA